MKEYSTNEMNMLLQLVILYNMQETHFGVQVPVTVVICAGFI